MDDSFYSEASFDFNIPEKPPPANGYHHTYNQSYVASLPPSPQHSDPRSISRCHWKSDDTDELVREELVLSCNDDTLSDEDFRKLKHGTSHLSIEQVLPMLKEFDNDVDRVIEFCKNVQKPQLMCPTTEQLFISNCTFMKRKIRNTRISEAPGLRTFFMTQAFKGNNYKTLVRYYYQNKNSIPYFMKVKKNKKYDPDQLQKLKAIQTELEQQEQEERRIAREERKRLREEKAKLKLAQNGEEKKNEAKKRKNEDNSAELPAKRQRLQRNRTRISNGTKLAKNENGQTSSAESDNNESENLEKVSPSNSITKSGRTVVRREPLDAEDVIKKTRQSKIPDVSPSSQTRKQREDWPERFQGRWVSKAHYQKLLAKAETESYSSDSYQSTPSKIGTVAKKSGLKRGRPRKITLVLQKKKSNGEYSTSPSSSQTSSSISPPSEMTRGMKPAKKRGRPRISDTVLPTTKNNKKDIRRSHDGRFLTRNTQTGDYEVVRAKIDDPNFEHYAERVRRRWEERSKNKI